MRQIESIVGDTVDIARRPVFAFNPWALDVRRHRAFHSAMEIESKHDDVRLALPRAQAEALLAAADDGRR